MDQISFINPTTLSPIFTAQQVVCVYPVSDLYASSPRYLYYALLTLCFVTHWTGWLANVFLGAAATYAGTAAIQAFILRANQPILADAEEVSIPFVSTPIAANLTGLPALVTGTASIFVRPTALELDIDPILAICVTGYLVLLPMQCWSRVAKANRARHLLITIWNVMMLAGAVTSLTLWPKSLDVPRQYRICYPQYVDQNSQTNDGWDSGVWANNWNNTIWQLFSNYSAATQLSDNCFYPCYNTSQILRKSTSINAIVYSPDTTPRLNGQDLEHRSTWISLLPGLMYIAFGVTAVVTIFLTIISWLRGLTRIPVGEPRLLWTKRKELWHELWGETCTGTRTVYTCVRNSKNTYSHLRSRPLRDITTNMLRIGRYWLDLFTVFLLILAMVLSPITIIALLVWIEWYIRRDGQNGETPRQVGQWTSSVAIGLILFSAAILQLKYKLASPAEIRHEIEDTRKHLDRLEYLLGVKEKEDRKNSVFSQKLSEQRELRQMGD